DFFGPGRARSVQLVLVCARSRDGRGILRPCSRYQTLRWTTAFVTPARWLPPQLLRESNRGPRHLLRRKLVRLFQLLQQLLELGPGTEQRREIGIIFEPVKICPIAEISRFSSLLQPRNAECSVLFSELFLFGGA